MNLDKENIRKIRGIILFTGVVVLALIKFDLLWETLVFIWEILQPFVVGGMMAFVANLPMTFFEKRFWLSWERKGSMHLQRAMSAALEGASASCWLI